MLTTYVFDDKYTGDVDGFTFHFAAWLGDADAFSQAPTVTITPSSATVSSVVVSGSIVTVWISGGIAGTAYTIDIEVRTTAGRDCHVRGTFSVEA